MLPVSLPPDVQVLRFRGLCQYPDCRTEVATLHVPHMIWFVNVYCPKCQAESQFAGSPDGIIARLIRPGPKTVKKRLDNS